MTDQPTRPHITKYGIGYLIMIVGALALIALKQEWACMAWITAYAMGAFTTS